MTSKLAGTAALVTGASSGIGAATARRLAQDGASVTLVARRRDRLQALAADIENAGGTALAVEADITDRTQAEAAVQQAARRFGRLDTLVNNAGLMLLGPIAGADPQEWDRMIAINVKGLLYTTRAAGQPARTGNPVLPPHRPGVPGDRFRGHAGLPRMIPRAATPHPARMSPGHAEPGPGSRSRPDPSWCGTRPTGDLLPPARPHHRPGAPLAADRDSPAPHPATGAHADRLVMRRHDRGQPAPDVRAYRRIKRGRGSAVSHIRSARSPVQGSQPDSRHDRQPLLEAAITAPGGIWPPAAGMAGPHGRAGGNCRLSPRSLRTSRRSARQTRTQWGRCRGGAGSPWR